MHFARRDGWRKRGGRKVFRAMDFETVPPDAVTLVVRVDSEGVPLSQNSSKSWSTDVVAAYGHTTNLSHISAPAVDSKARKIGTADEAAMKQVRFTQSPRPKTIPTIVILPGVTGENDQVTFANSDPWCPVRLVRSSVFKLKNLDLDRRARMDSVGNRKGEEWTEEPTSVWVMCFRHLMLILQQLT